MSEIADKAVELPEGPWKDWLGGIGTFEQDVNSNVNLYIKEITGAQMSEAEASRLTKGRRKPG